MEIEIYSPQKMAVCLSIFDSNKPAYFLEHERPLFINFLDTRPPHHYYLLNDGKRIIACGGIYEESDEIAGLSWGMVHNKFHGKGFGRLLTEYRIEKMRQVFPDHKYKIETSQHTSEFYRKMGFVESHRIKDGFGLGLDKVLMWYDSGY